MGRTGDCLPLASQKARETSFQLRGLRCLLERVSLNHSVLYQQEMRHLLRSASPLPLTTVLLGLADGLLRNWL
jgi:hypothetical protein